METSNKKHQFIKKLLKYSAAAGAAIAVAHPIGAEIQYSGDKNLTVDNDNTPFYIDMDGDGNDDFSFDCKILAARYWCMAMAPEGGNTLLVELPDNGVGNLNYGNSVKDHATLNTCISTGYLNCDFYEWGKFKNTEGYIGVNFLISGDSYYGWIRYEGTVVEDGLYKGSFGYSGIIKDWAYEDKSDTNIKAGHTHTYYRDSDGDGYGDPLNTATGGESPPSGYISDNTDCNDNDSSDTYYRDNDGDGYGDGSITINNCSGAPSGYAANADDCDDNDSMKNKNCSSNGKYESPCFINSIADEE